MYRTVICKPWSLKYQSVSKVDRINCFCENKCKGRVPAVQTCTFLFRDRNSLCRLLLFPIHLKSIVGGLSEEMQYRKLLSDLTSFFLTCIFGSWSQMFQEHCVLSLFFFKHLIPFLIETRQEESLRWEKTGLKWILSTWDVFQL